MRTAQILSVIALLGLALGMSSVEPATDPRLKGGSRRPELNGWIFVHLQGSPSEIGFQHGYLLAEEIAEAQKVLELNLTHDTEKPYAFFRETAEKVLWPRVEEEYRQELEAIVAGLKARNVALDIWDVVVMNATLELPYYVNWLKKAGEPKAPIAERCSAFVATGSYTRDGRVVMAHNAWTGYADGARWNIIFDIVPAGGHRILMDGFPGYIHSADDFGMNSAGIMITETTISRFSGFDPNARPEFVRARKAMQYSESIDDFARIMTDGNNGGYANNWLVADRKTNEIASLELGLKNVNLLRTRDGYFAGANFAVNIKLIKEETDYPVDDAGFGANSRRLRWDQLLAENKGRVDVEAAKRFLADHYDAYEGQTAPSERTICGHIDLSSRGVSGWWGPYGPAGAVQNKVADAAMAERMSLFAVMGHACGLDFRAAPHLAAHPEFSWQKQYLRDLRAGTWSAFESLLP